MPRIELIDPVYYGPLDPIHWEIDNLPLKNILRRQNLINLSLDNVLEQIRDAIGTSGSMSNRLNISISADGSLKTQAIDDALHSIEEHEDTDTYVRMTKEAFDKLTLIAEGATSLGLKIYTNDVDFVEFDTGTLKLKASSTITPTFESPDILKLDMAFPEEAAHQHYYGQIPVHSNIVTPDFTNYKFTNTDPDDIDYVDGSLRVFVNGVRIFEGVEVYAPGPLVDAAWTLLSFTADYDQGTFELSSALSEDDVITIDFDVLLA